jgi:hypothetical protein
MNTSLVLRVCKSDFSSRHGFVWPSEIGAIANCPDFVDSNECGNGLHGWLNGMGDSAASDLVDVIDTKWLVLEVETDKIIDLGGKVKFPSAKVIFIGSRGECANYIYDRVPDCPNVIGLEKIGGDGSTLTGGYNSKLTGGNYSVLTGGYGSTLTGGYNSKLTGGDGSTLTGGYNSKLTGGDGSTLTGGVNSKLTGGDGSTLTGGDGSTLTGGYNSKLTGGYNSKLTGGENSTLTGGNYSTLTGGENSTLTSGNYSTLTGGENSTLTGGNYSTLTGGENSTLTSGNYSTLTGGENSTLIFKYYQNGKIKIKVAYVGEDGIEADVPYTLDNKFNVVKSMT